MQIATQQFTNILSIILARQKCRVLTAGVCVCVCVRGKQGQWEEVAGIWKAFRYKGINSNYFVILIKPVRAH